MDDLVQFTDLGMKIADEIAENADLDLEAARIVVLVVLMHRARLYRVGTFFDDHGCASFRSV